MPPIQHSLIDEHPVAAFFIGAYAYTWIISAPAVFMEPSWTAAILIYVGSFGPPVSAAVVTWLRGDDVREWASQITKWRVGWKWWIVAFSLPLVAAALISLGIFAVRGPIDFGRALPSPVLFTGLFLFTLVLSGGLNEEPGWRGFAQARLNERYGAFSASLIIGVVWAGWHLPYFLAPVTPHSSFPLVNQVGWIGGILTLSVILAWAYNSTGSVLIVMVLHAMANTADVLIPLVPDEILIDGVINERAVGTVTVVHLVVYTAIALAIVAYYGRKSLARGSIPGPADIGGSNS
ncbi:CPBP family intramembrane glutamic endopeptidase [Haloferax sulfurifontis]|uniref:Abortive infection protein n=1 Tax=Haloferax sulfurifontis ATCC BAA-897 TaxID=662480 RepID=M0HX41_9EURY|nr:type II CAAX endopeptidase family protein [Haloferax sulfurifontis]ELZ88298.1 abortive infection protein [Haloferax sulfurifontis ATCC BAA-897]